MVRFEASRCRSTRTLEPVTELDSKLLKIVAYVYIHISNSMCPTMHVYIYLLEVITSTTKMRTTTVETSTSLACRLINSNLSLQRHANISTCCDEEQLSVRRELCMCIYIKLMCVVQTYELELKENYGGRPRRTRK